MQKIFTNSYEPSGIVQLKDGQVLIADDDGLKPFSLWSFNSKSPFDTLHKSIKMTLSEPIIDDLEALTTDLKDNIYAITSHSLDAQGKLKKKRCQFVCFKLKKGKIKNVLVINKLRQWLIKQYPHLLKRSAKIKKVQKRQGLNIEALAYDPNTKQLLIGFRSPLNKDHKAIIIPLQLSTNASTPDLFSNALLKNQANKPIMLDLKGAGLRDFTYVPKLRGFLILSGSVCDSKKSTKLWFWQRDKKLCRVRIKGIKKLGRAEGITPVTLHNKKEGIMLVMDDGDQDTAQGGHYLFIAYKHLKM